MIALGCDHGGYELMQEVIKMCIRDSGNTGNIEDKRWQICSHSEL